MKHLINTQKLDNKIKTMQEKSIYIMSDYELKQMKKVGSLAAKMLQYLEHNVKPGISTAELDYKAVKWAKLNNVINAPLGYHGFPKSICTSINEVVCHGIPNKNDILKNGDIINIDITIIQNGYHADTSKTFLIGKPDIEAKKLVQTCKECLICGIKQVAPNKKIGDIGYAIQNHAEYYGFSVVRDFVGHGIGKEFHTEPQIPHYGNKNQGTTLKQGMVFTIEPMINLGTHKVKIFIL